MTFTNPLKEKPTVDFDWFHFEGHGYNYDIAKEIASILMAYINIDDLHGYNEVDGVYYNSSVGTGGWGNMKCTSPGVQRACLASLLSSYSHKHDTHCYLSIYEYECIKDLLHYLTEDYFPSQHQELIWQKDVELLEKLCSEFEKAYVRVEPGFLFEILKDTV